MNVLQMKAGVILVDSLENYLKTFITPQQGIKLQYECRKCKDSGWILSHQNGNEEYKRCDCYKLRRAKELIERSGISKELCRMNFNNFDTRNNQQLVNAKNKAIQYVNRFSEFEHERYNSILFCGQVGSGKTHLGTAICGMLMRSGVAVVYMAYRNVITRIKQNITDEAEYTRELNCYMQARVLYIDDLLKGKLTETDINIMYEIINYRYMNNLPVIISTEKKPEELIAFDEAVGSRLIEMCRGNIVLLTGKDLNYRLS